MADDFMDELRGGAYEEQEENPDWMQETPAEDDEFDQLRRKSVRTGAMHGEMADDEELGRSGISLNNLTPTQRLILAVLLLLDIIVIGFGVLVVIGVF